MARSSGWSRRDFLKTAAVGVGGAAVLGGCAHARYLREGKRGPAAFSRPFNTGWLFGEAAGESDGVDFDDRGLRQVTLPHTVTALSWRSWDPASWEKDWVYRKHFTPEEGIKGRRVFLRLGAAMTKARVSLNGNPLGEHTGGYLPFDFEITKHLRPDENLLAVRLDARFAVNVPPNKLGRDSRSVDFWQPGGLYRPAYLDLVPQVFIADLFAKPSRVLQSDRRVEVQCTIDAAVIPDEEMRVEIELSGGSQVIRKVSAPVLPGSAGQAAVALSLDQLKDVRFWDIVDPCLYTVKATLFIGGRRVHDHAVRIGFREARFTRKGFFLNGKRLQLFGVNRHQFYPFAGAAMPDRVQRRDVEILKKDLNCNMVRCSHYPQSEAFFDACDELGLLAWEEAAGWGSPLGNEEWKRRALDAVSKMIYRDRNHPSIIVWGARLNETPDDVSLYTKARELAYRLDGSRQTTGAMVGGLHDTKNFVQDLFSYNDYKKSKSADGKWQPELLPPRNDFPYLVSEAVGTLSGPAKYYRRTDDVLVQQGQAMAHARVHDLAASDERYSGLLAWSGMDYPSGSGNQFEGVKYTGVVDLFRGLKPGAAIYQAQTDPEKNPVIVPAFYWHFGPQAFPYKNGEPAMICSNCERLELFIDGRHFATVFPDRKSFPHLPYPPSFVDLDKLSGEAKPELRIEGYLGYRKVISRSFASDTAGDRLWAEADDHELIADGSDATRVAFRVADKFGMPRPFVKGEVVCALEGPGLLIGDNPFALEAAGGAGAVWIRSRAMQPGVIRLAVSHASGSREINIKARRPDKSGLSPSF